MIRIYKLKYTDRETAIADLIAKGVYQEIEGELSYGDGIDAVVEVGLIIDQEATFDEKENHKTLLETQLEIYNKSQNVLE
jgi:hypothetical protein